MYLIIIYSFIHLARQVQLQIKTRRPASADRTARAANFRRDLEAT